MILFKLTGNEYYEPGFFFFMNLLLPRSFQNSVFMAAWAAVQIMLATLIHCFYADSTETLNFC